MSLKEPHCANTGTSISVPGRSLLPCCRFVVPCQKIFFYTVLSKEQIRLLFPIVSSICPPLMMSAGWPCQAVCLASVAAVAYLMIYALRSLVNWHLQKMCANDSSLCLKKVAHVWPNPAPFDQIICRWKLVLSQNPCEY